MRAATTEEKHLRVKQTVSGKRRDTVPDWLTDCADSQRLCCLEVAGEGAGRSDERGKGNPLCMNAHANVVKKDDLFRLHLEQI